MMRLYDPIRSTLYRNLYDPFEREYRNRCSRWDIINLVRATRDLRPEGISFEKLNPETNAPSFKLTDLTEENHIEQTHAHDALCDVEATIAVAKLIKEKQPRLFDWALKHRAKNTIANEIRVLEHIPFLHTCPLFVSERGNTHPLLPLFYEAGNQQRSTASILPWTYQQPQKEAIRKRESCDS